MSNVEKLEKEVFTLQAEVARLKLGATHYAAFFCSSVPLFVQLRAVSGDVPRMTCSTNSSPNRLFNGPECNKNR
jgi:hypothetical protein